MRSLRAKLCFVVLVLGGLLFSAVLSASEPDYRLHQWQVNEDEFVIVNIRLNGISVLSDLSAYYTSDEKLLLAITPLKPALGIDFSVNNKVINGLIPKSNIVFSALMQSAPSKTLDDLLWAEDDFDYYVDLELLNTVLDLEVTFDYGRMQLNFSTQLLESRKKSKTEFKVKQKRERTFEQDIADQYQQVTFPVTDYTLSSKYSSKRKLENKFTVNSYFDLLKHKAELRLNYSDTSSNQFVKFSKSLENPNQAGILSDVHYELGDIQSQRDPLIMDFSQGRGVFLTNISSNTLQSFSTITIEEAILPGWFAELYRNGQFVNAAESTDENIVRFENVETFYGSNVFEIRLYGPEGEQEVRTKKISVGKEALAPGQLAYQFEVLDSTRNLLNDQVNRATNFRQSLSGNLSYGLTDTLTYGIGVDYLTGLNDSQYISSSLQNNSEFGSVKLVAAKQLDRGTALFAGYRGEAAVFKEQNISINFEYSQINNFNSVVYRPEKFPLKSRATLSLSSRISSFDNLNWNIRLINEHRAQKKARQISQIGLNSNYLNGNWSTRFDYDNLRQEVINQSYWAMNLKAWRWTHSVNWTPFEDDKNVKYQSSLRWPQSKKNFNQTRLIYDPNANFKTILSHQYSFRGKHFNVNLSGQYDSGNEWQVTLGLSGTLNFDPFNSDLNFLPPRSLSAGQLAVESYIDTNDNGLFDAQDEPISDIGFTGNYLWKELRTNEQGQVMLPSSSNGQIINVDYKTLANPYYQPLKKGIKAISHRGGETKVPFPIRVVNEVEGMLYYSTGNKSRPAPEVTVKLLDATGMTKYETTTEYDGYYFFPKIAKGEYTLQFSQSQINSDNLIVQNAPNKVVTPDYGDTITLRDIILQDKSQIGVPYADTEKSFYVQLGVFKHLSSAQIVATKNRSLKLPMRLYQNNNHGNYYLVTGPYNSKPVAQSVINKAYVVPELFGSFLIDARKYGSESWQLVDDNTTLNTVNNAHSKKRQYYCQYAAYRNPDLINKTVLETNKSLFLKEVTVSEEVYTVILSGPFSSNDTEQCDASIGKQLNSNQLPIIKHSEGLPFERELSF